MIPALFFYLFAGVCVASAFMVIAAKNPVHSVLYLILAFVNASGLFVLMGAEFLAMILIVVYVGAVMVLFLFVVMMLDVNIEKLREGFARNAPLGALIALIVIIELYYAFWVRHLGLDVTGGTAPLPENYSNTAEIGAVLYTEYVYPFQLAAVVLLIAIIAAITLTMRKRRGQKVQDISRQVSVRSRDRVRIVKMPTEREP